MSRRARFTFENATYHILSRGNNKQAVFLMDDDYIKFLELMLFYKEKYSLQVYHYGLMPNHYHLIVQAADGLALASAMKGINLSYTKYYRRKYGGIGYLWQGRFKSFIIQNGRYILQCGRYVELNPVKAGMVDRVEIYPWTSYRVYGAGERNSIIDMDPEYLGLGRNSKERQTIYRQFVMSGLKEERSLERYFRDRVYGSKDFVEMLKKERSLKQIWSHSGRPRKRAERRM